MNSMAADAPPAEVARQLIQRHGADPLWMHQFLSALARQRDGRQVERVLAVWGLSQAELGRLFGVTRQAVSRWLVEGAPSTQLEAFADLAAATDLLVHYLEADRIPAVVRRPAARLDGRSLIDLVEDGDTRAVLEACRSMFDFAGVGQG